MWAHKLIISARTTDFQPTLMYQSTSADLRQQCLTSFCAVCGVLFDYKRESTVVSSGVRAVCSWQIFVPTRLSVCIQPFVTKLGIVVHHHEPECHARKMGFYLQGQGLYNQNMTVSTISFISSKPVSLLQPNSIWWLICKEVSSENIGLLYSKAMVKRFN